MKIKQANLENIAKEKMPRKRKTWVLILATILPLLLLGLALGLVFGFNKSKQLEILLQGNGSFVVLNEEGKTIEGEGGKFVLDNGTTVSVVVSPNLGEKLESITINKEMVEVVAGEGESQTIVVEKIDKNTTIEVVFTTRKFNVSFVGFNNFNLGSQTVEYGKSAIAPQIPTVEGYTFKSWDTDFSNVTSNLVVNAIYEINKYEVVFQDFDGTQIGETQIVNWGSSATAPQNPTREGHEFVGWFANINGSETQITDFANIKENLTVKAKYNINIYGITASAGLNGNVEPKESNVEFGGSLTIVITPNEGYKIDKILVDGEEIGFTAFTDGSYNYLFENVSHTHTLHATFKKKVYTVQTNITGNGAIYGNLNVEYGEGTSLTITPDEGHYIQSIVVDGKNVGVDALWGASQVYTFANVKNNPSIEVVFAKQIFTVDFYGYNGNLVVSKPVYYGDLIVAPEISSVDGYNFIGWFTGENGQGEKLAEETKAVANQKFYAHYEIIKYTVSTLIVDKNGNELNLNNQNGTITESTEVVWGENLNIIISPKIGYEISKVIVNESEIDFKTISSEIFSIDENGVGTYKLKNIKKDYEIKVVFEIKTFEVSIKQVENGTISITSPEELDLAEVEYGTQIEFKFTPSDEYHFVGEILANGKPVSGTVDEGTNSQKYVLTVKEDCEISAVFTEYQYSIKVEQVGQGAIVAAGKEINQNGLITNVVNGEEVEFTISPADGFVIYEIKVDGNKVQGEVVAGTNKQTYSLTISKNHTIFVEFKENFVVKFYGENELTPYAEKLANPGEAVLDWPSDPEKQGYEFDGWFTKDGEKWGQEVTSETLIESDLNLYAKFTKLFTVNVQIEGLGSVDGEKTIREGENANLTINPADRTDYDGTYIASIVKVIGENEEEIEVQALNGDSQSLVIENITQDVTIKVVFEERDPNFNNTADGGIEYVGPVDEIIIKVPEIVNGRDYAYIKEGTLPQTMTKLILSKDLEQEYQLQQNNGKVEYTWMYHEVARTSFAKYKTTYYRLYTGRGLTEGQLLTEGVATVDGVGEFGWKCIGVENQAYPSLEEGDLAAGRIYITSVPSSENETLIIPQTLPTDEYGDLAVYGIVGDSGNEQSLEGVEGYVSVEVQYGIEHIGDYSFFAGALSEIILSNSITTIGKYAFAITKISEIVLPEDLTQIEEYAFVLTSLTEIKIPANVEIIEPTALSGIQLLERFVVDPNNKAYATDGRSLITKDGLVLIAYANKSGSTYEIPNGVIVVEEAAFAMADALKEITIPTSVKLIKDHALDDCSSLEKIYLLGDLQEFYPVNEVDKALYMISGDATGIVEGLLFNGEYYFGPRPSQDFQPGVTYISLNGFGYKLINGKYHIVSVPAFIEGVTSTTLTIPASLETEKHGTIQIYCVTSIINYEGYKHLVFKNGIKAVDGSVSNLEGIERVSIPESLISMTSHQVSDGVAIEMTAFSLCMSLKQFEVDNNNSAYKTLSDGKILASKDGKTLYVYAGGTGETSISIPEGIERVSGFAFAHLEHIEEISFPASLKSVGAMSFGETGLVSVEFPAGFEKIDPVAFLGCASLTEITLNSDLKTGLSVAYILGGMEAGKWWLYENFITMEINEAGVYTYEEANINELNFTVEDALETEQGFGVVLIDGNAYILTVPECDGINLTLTIPATVDVLEEGTKEVKGILLLNNSEGYKHLVISEGVERIGTGIAELDMEVYGTGGILKDIETVSLPSTLAKMHFRQTMTEGEITIEILATPFIGASSLKKITVAEGNSKYLTNENGTMLLSKNGKTLYFQLAAGEESIIVPDSVEKIASFAIIGGNAHEVRLPNTVTSVGMGMLAGVNIENLETIYIPSNLGTTYSFLVFMVDGEDFIFETNENINIVVVFGEEPEQDIFRDWEANAYLYVTQIELKVDLDKAITLPTTWGAPWIKDGKVVTRLKEAGTYKIERNESGSGSAVGELETIYSGNGSVVLDGVEYVVDLNNKAIYDLNGNLIASNLENYDDFVIGGKEYEVRWNDMQILERANWIYHDIEFNGYAVAYYQGKAYISAVPKFDGTTQTLTIPTSLTINGQVVQIYGVAGLNGYEGYTELVISEGIVALGNPFIFSVDFMYMGFETITIPSTLTQVVFEENVEGLVMKVFPLISMGVKEFIVSENNPSIKTDEEGKILLSKDGKELYQIVSTWEEGTTIVVPDSVESIGSYSMLYIVADELVLSKNLKEMSLMVGMVQLGKLTFPQEAPITQIPTYAFMESMIGEIVLSENIKTIGEEGLLVSGLQKITLTTDLSMPSWLELEDGKCLVYNGVQMPYFWGKGTYTVETYDPTKISEENKYYTSNGNIVINQGEEQFELIIDLNNQKIYSKSGQEIVLNNSNRFYLGAIELTIDWENKKITDPNGIEIVYVEGFNYNGNYYFVNWAEQSIVKENGEALTITENTVYIDGNLFTINWNDKTILHEYGWYNIEINLGNMSYNGNDYLIDWQNKSVSVKNEWDSWQWIETDNNKLMAGGRCYQIDWYEPRISDVTYGNTQEINAEIEIDGYGVVIFKGKAFLLSVPKYDGSTTTLTIPSSIYFEGVGNLEIYGVASIKGYEGYTDLVFSEGIVDIASGIMFAGEPMMGVFGIQTITIPASMSEVVFSMEMEGIALEGAGIMMLPSLKKIIVAPENPSVKTNEDGTMLLSKDGKQFLMYTAGAQRAAVEIPEGVEKIGAFALGYAMYVEEVVLPSTLKTIGMNALTMCMVKEIIIPKSVTSIQLYAFMEAFNLTKVSFEESCGLSEIPEGAFTGTMIETIIIPEGVTKIGYEAFKDCLNLKFVSLPSTLKLIEEGAFENCSSLTGIILPNRVVVEEYAFRNCSSLTTLVLDGNNITLDDNAFGNHSYGSHSEVYLKTLVLTDNVKELDESFIKRPFAKNITNIYVESDLRSSSYLNESNEDYKRTWTYTSLNGTSTITSSIQKAGVYRSDEPERNKFTVTFYRADGSVLGAETVIKGNSVHFYQTPTAPYGYKFAKWDKDLTNVTSDLDVYPVWQLITDGCWTKDENGNDQYRYWGIPSTSGEEDDIIWYIAGVDQSLIENGVLIIPSTFKITPTSEKEYQVYGIKNKNQEAIWGAYDCQSVVISEGIKEIGSYAFNNCGIREISFPSSLEEIGSSVFSSCSGLTEIILPENLETIGAYAFSGTGLTEIILPVGLTTIGTNAFYLCSELQQVTIKSNYLTIENNAFANCENLKTLVIESSVLQINQSALTNTFENVVKIEVKEGATVNLTLPKRTSYVWIKDGNVAVKVDSSGIYNLLKTYEEQEFENWKYFSDGENWWIVGVPTLEQNENLTELTIPAVLETEKFGNVKIFGIKATSNAGITNLSSYSSVVISNGIKQIGANAFENCTGLTNLTINGNMDYVDVNTFKNVSTLQTATFGPDVTTLPSNLIGGKLPFVQAIQNNAGSIANSVLPATIKVREDQTIKLKPVIWFKVENGELVEAVAEISSTGKFIAVYVEETYTTTDGWKYQCIDEKWWIVGVPEGTGTLIIPSTLTTEEFGEIQIHGIKSLNENSAIENANGYSSVVIESVIKVIGENVFKNCENLTAVGINGNDLSISETAFAGCSNIRTLNIGADVTELPENLFDSGYLNQINKIVVVEGSNLEETLPSELTNSNGNAGATAWFKDSNETPVTEFSGAGTYTVKLKETTYETTEGWQYQFIDGKWWVVGVPEGNGELIIEPTLTSEEFGEIQIQGIKSLNENSAITNAEGYSSVVIEGGIKEIGENVFKNCENLTAVGINGNDLTISNTAFAGCSNIRTLNIGADVTELPENLFDDNCLNRINTIVVESGSNLDVALPTTLTNSNGNAGATVWFKVGETDSVTEFSGQGTYVVQLKNTTYVHSGWQYQFDGENWWIVGTTRTGTQSIPGNLETNEVFGEIDIYGIKSVENNSAMSGFENIRYLTIGENVIKVIGENAFNGLKNLISVNIDYGTETIGEYAFNNCSATINFANNVEVLMLGEYAFSNSKLSSIKLGSSMTEIPANAFSGTTNLTSIELPENLKTIGENAFAGSRILSLKLPIGIEEIGEHAFANSRLQEVEIVSNLEALSLPSNVFAGSTGLNTLIIRDAVTTDLNSNLFNALTELSKIRCDSWDMAGYPLPTIEGGYWVYSAEEGEEPEDFRDEGTDPQRFRDMAGFYTVYKKLSVTLNYEKIVDGETISQLETREIDYKEPVIFEEGFATKPGFRLVGWFFKDDQGNYTTQYTDFENISQTMVLYAKYVEQKTITIEATGNGSVEIVELIGNGVKETVGSTTTLEVDINTTSKFLIKPNEKTDDVYYYINSIKVDGNPVTITALLGDSQEIKIASGTLRVVFRQSTNGTLVVPDGSDMTDVDPTEFEKVVISGDGVDLPNFDENGDGIIWVDKDGEERQGKEPGTYYPIYSGKTSDGKPSIVYVTDIGWKYMSDGSHWFVVGVPTVEQNSESKTLILPNLLQTEQHGEIPVYGIAIENKLVEREGALTSIENLSEYDSLTIQAGEIKGYQFTVIGESVFENCAISSVVLPETLKTIGKKAFKASGIINITIPQGIETIEEETFANCSSLSTVTITGENLKTIDTKAFQNSTLTTIALPTSVTTIGNFAFESSGLTEIYIPENVSLIGEGALRNCVKLNRIKVANENETYKHDGNVYRALLSFDGKTFIQYALDSASRWLGGENYEIPSSVETIGEYAFYGCSASQSSIMAPSSVKAIESRAFYNCSGISISFAEGSVISSLGDYAFYNCEKLTSITLGNGITTIPAGAFNNSGLTSVEIPEGVTSVRNYVFENCSKLETVTIPASVKSIGSGAFKNCSNAQITFVEGSEIDSLGGGAFQNCVGLTKIALSKNLRDLDGWVFYGCTGLTEITINGNVTSFWYSEFKGCVNLKTLYLGENVTTIYSRLFEYPSTNENPNTHYNLGYINKIVVAEGSTLKASLSTKMFNENGEYDVVWVKDGEIVNELNGGGTYYALETNKVYETESGWQYLADGENWWIVGVPVLNEEENLNKELTIPNKLATEYGEIDVYGIKSTSTTFGITNVAAYESIEISNGIEVVGGYAFYLGTLKNLTLSTNLSEIGDNAFVGAIYLKTLAIAQNVTTLPENFFVYGETNNNNLGFINKIIVEEGSTLITRLPAVIYDFQTAELGLASYFVSWTNKGIVEYINGGGTYKTIEQNKTLYSNGWEYQYDGENWWIVGAPTNEKTSIYGPDGAEIEITIDSDNDNIGKLIINGANYRINQDTKELQKLKIIGYEKIEINPDNTFEINGTIYQIYWKDETSLTIPSTLITTEFGQIDIYGLKSSINASGMTNASTYLTIEISDGIKEIGDSAFFSCASLSSFDIPSSVTTIGQQAFAGASGLTEITINGILESIGNNAFYNCPNLKTLNLGSEVSEVPAQWFATGKLREINTIIVADGSTLNCALPRWYSYFLWVKVDNPSAKSISGKGVVNFDGAGYYCRVVNEGFAGDYGYEFDENMNLLINEVPSATIANATLNLKENLGVSRSGTTGTIQVKVDGLIGYVNKWGGREAVKGITTYSGITIPSTYEIIGEGAFVGCSNLTSIEIPANITTIGDGAFSGSSILSIIFEKGTKLETIGDYAFSGCERLHTFQTRTSWITVSYGIPKGVKYIGDYAFSGCYQLDFAFTMKAGVAYGKGVFKNCYNIVLQKIEDGVVEIPEYMFYNIDWAITNGTTLTLPASLNVIGDCAFQMDSRRFTDLEQINIKGNIERVGENCFENHENLVEINIASSVDSLPENLFDIGNLCYIKEITNKSKFLIGTLPHYLMDSDGTIKIVTWFKDGVELVLDESANYGFNGSGCYTSTFIETIVYETKSGWQYQIDGMGNVWIVGFPFRGDKLIIPASLKTTEHGEVEIYGIKQINNFDVGIFSSYESVEIANGIKKIVGIKFNGALHIKNFVLPESIESIPYDFFSGSPVSTIVVGNNNLICDLPIAGDQYWLRVGEDQKLSQINGSGTYYRMGSNIVYLNPDGWQYQFDGENWWIVGVPSLNKQENPEKTLTIPQKLNVVGFGEIEIYGIKNKNNFDVGILSSYESVEIANGIYEIGASVFYGCSSLTSISLPNSLLKIGKKAFAYSGLSSILIPENVETIESRAFEGCSKLKSIQVSYKNNNFASSADKKTLLSKDLTTLIVYANASGKNYTIPSSVTTIKEYAFYDCDDLSYVLLPDNNCAIEDYAFADCSNLNAITIFSKITSLGDKAFEYCYNLKNLNLGRYATAFPKNLFTNSNLRYINRIIVADGSSLNLELPTTLLTTTGSMSGTEIWYKDGTKISEKTFSGAGTYTVWLQDTTYVHNGWQYQYDGYYWHIVGVPKGAGELIIPSILETNEIFGTIKIRSIKSPSEYYAITNISDYSSVIISNGIEEIGDYAFYGCSFSLKSLTLNGNIRRIGKHAFYYCEHLTTLILGENVTEFREGYFSYGYTNGYYFGFVTTIIVKNSNLTFALPDGYNYSLTGPAVWRKNGVVVTQVNGAGTYVASES